METKRKIRFIKIKETDQSILSSASVPIEQDVNLTGWSIIDYEGEIKVIPPSRSYRDNNSGDTKYKDLIWFRKKEIKDNLINKIKEEYEVWREEEKKLDTLKDKVHLFKEIFKGREDVFAKFWQNSKGNYGYQPACINEWKKEICSKPCSTCANNKYLPLSDNIILNHLRGRDDTGKPFRAGIYPLLEDDNSYFIAADFDGDCSLEEVKIFMKRCSEYEISTYLERSRSGAGYHVWTFFEEMVPARKSRAVMLTILEESGLNKNNKKGFDRLFPNQDSLTGRGFGNLIALPLQRESVKENKTVFIDPLNQYETYQDQWKFLRTIKKISEKKFDQLIQEWHLNPPVNIAPSLGQLGNQKGLEVVIENCDFIKDCVYNAERLKEPLWYCMISNLAVFEGGTEKIHEFSKPYPEYTRNETDAKILHALRDTKPHNCETIRKEGFNCMKRCNVKSPAGLAKKLA